MIAGDQLTHEHLIKVRDRFAGTGDGDKVHHALVALGERRAKRGHSRDESLVRCAELYHRYILTRDPLPPPFALGTRLRYLGTRHVRANHNGGPMVDVIAPGIEVTIVEVNRGRPGTGQHLKDEDGPMFYDDAQTEPIFDETKDGYSVYRVDVPGMERGPGRAIHVDTKHEWEIIGDGK